MECFQPISIQRTGQGNPRDRITVPCGTCPPCYERKAQEWAFRLQAEAKNSSSAYFITLKYGHEDHLGNVQKRDIQLFLKRLRKHSKFRYFMISEYGPRTNRPHYHGAIFNFKGTAEAFNQLIYKSWGQGSVTVDNLLNQRINYISGYMIGKAHTPEGLEPTFAIMSRKPGIGADYLKTHFKHHKTTLRGYVTLPGGIKAPLHRYYKDKIFDSRDKEIINQEFIRIREQRAAETYERLKNNGEDPEIWDAESKRQYIERYEKKRLKKNKL